MNKLLFTRRFRVNAAGASWLGSGRFVMATAIVCGSVAGFMPAWTVPPAAAKQFSTQEIMEFIATPISVPAGQTTTFKLPLVAEASYSGEGWTVEASGGSATVTAPAAGGTISIPVTAQGQTAMVQLVATPSGNGKSPGAAPNSPGAAGTAGTAGTAGAAGAGGAAGSGGSVDATDINGAPAAGGTNGSVQSGAPAVPAGTPSEGYAADASAAEHLYLNGKIADNVITVKLGITEAFNLYKRFGNIDESQYALRFLDARGNQIKGVQRHIDATTRTLTLVYPEGQAPDNPFIMQLVHKDSGGVYLQATIRDANYASADNASPEQLAAEAKAASQPAHGGFNLLLWGAVGAVILLLLLVSVLVLVLVTVVRSRRGIIR